MRCYFCEVEAVSLTPVDILPDGKRKSIVVTAYVCKDCAAKIRAFHVREAAKLEGAA